MKKTFGLITLLLWTVALWATDPSVVLTTYYAGINGKATDSKDALRTALCTIISANYQSTSYGSLKNSIYAASNNPSDFVDGSSKTLEDIYSSRAYVASDNGSSATTCGTGWNKEHTVPQSWFEEASPMVSDAFHVYPTDIKMNSLRSNYPYGENNVDKECEQYGYGHLGYSTFEGYNGYVFDPGDGGTKGSYKGDIARTYFYMVTRYRTQNFTSGTGYTSFTYSNGVANLTTYMQNLMLKWHREDTVSEKERLRNNAIYAHQRNRNPFIDYPCLVEYIWGSKKGDTVQLAKLISSYDTTFKGEGCGCDTPDTPIVTTYQVTLVRNGQEEVITDLSGTYTLPKASEEANACGDWVFQGWLADTIPFTEGTTTAPTAWTTSTTTAGVFHAVYSMDSKQEAAIRKAVSAVVFVDSLNISGTNQVASRTGWSKLSNTYGGNGSIRLSTGNNAGLMTTNALKLSGTTTISFELKAWSGAENGKLTLSASSGALSPSDFTATTMDFTSCSTTLTGATDSTTLTFTGTTKKRAYLKNLVITNQSSTITTYRQHPTCGVVTEVEDLPMVSSVQKTMRGNQVVILRDGRMYNLLGERIQ